MRKVIIEKAIHKDRNVLCLKFERDPELEALVRTLPECHWSNTMRCWHFPNQPAYLRKALAILRPVATIDFTQVVERQQQTTNINLENEKAKPVARLPELSKANTHSIEQYKH